MKPLLRSIAALSAACGLVSAADSTHELRDSLLARGDFNGDGRIDVAVVDRVTGLVRIAHPQVGGALVWSEGHHTGIAPATGVAVGKFLAATRDALAVTSTTANRTNVFNLADPLSLPVPLSVFTPATGPTGVSAAQVVGGTTLEEIIIHHTENGATPQARAFARFSGAPVTAAVFQPALPAPPVPDLELRPRRIEGLATASIGSFTGTSPSAGFRLLRVGTSPVQLLASLNGLPAGADFVHADFDGSATTSPAQFVFFKRGSATLHRSSLSVANAFSPLATTDAGSEIEHVTAVARSGGGWNLLVVFETGWAQLFSFDGQSAPVPGEVFPAPADGGFLGAFASVPGDFHLLAGPPGLPPGRAHRFTWNGSSHAPNGISDLPPLRSSRPATNVFAFNDDPFIATDAVLLGSFSAGEWTREGKIVAGAVEAAQSRFADPTSGLGSFTEVNLGPQPPGTTFVMTNEIPSFQPGVPSYASAYGPTRALGRTIGEVTITPAPGRMLRSIRPTFTAPPGVSVFWRIGGGGWISLPAQAPGWQFQAFTIQWFGRGAGDATTPVYQAAYTFAESADTLDSDDDGVPDFVEIAKGLDPILSNDDGDGDGASDLLELLTDRSPTNDADFPTRTNNPPGATEEFDGNYQNTFFFRITPLAIAGSTRYATLGAEAAGVAVHDPTGIRLGGNQTVGSTPQHARIGNIQAGYAGSLLVAGTDANFNLTAAVPNKRRGRELVGLIPVPASDLGPVPFSYPGGDLTAAANAWIAAAKAHHSQPVPSAAHTLDATTTLSLLLVELKFEEILRARSELGPAQTLSLTPFRPAESTRLLEDRTGAPADAAFRLAAADMDRLRRFAGTPPAFSYANGWRPTDIQQSLNAALATPPSPAVTELVRLAREIHFLCAAADDTTLPQFPPPIDTLRRFLRTGRLPGDTNEDGVLDPGETLGYWGNLTLTPAQVATAHSAIAPLLALPQPRPTTSGVFVVDANTFNGPVPVVREISTLAPHVLLQGNGEPWPLAQFAPLVPGAELTVTGFSDVTSPHAASAIEVITLSLTHLPSAPADLDNNLLGDGWQGLFPGIAEDGPFTDSDGDGASDLQEYLDGTDPTDPLSIPPGGPVDLTPPSIEITEAAAPGTFQISFNYPAAYAEKISFHLQQTATLTTPFADTGVLIPHLGSGLHRIPLNPAAANSTFWRARMGLK
jgi:hypothetical protein